QTKLISTLRLLIPRLRLLQKKDTASSVVQRRELSALLEEGRDASARIRVENVIATDIAVEVMEMVELYCELLLARANVLDQIAFGEKGARARTRAREEAGARDAVEEYMDTALDEAALSVMYAWSRFPHDVRELTMLRTQLAERYGKEFLLLAQENKADIRVPERLVKGLRIQPPAPELVELYLREIAKAYGVAWPKEEWDAEKAKREAEGILKSLDIDDDHDDHDNNRGGDELLPPSTPSRSRPSITEMRRASEADELSKATPPRTIEPGRSPVSVAPPGPRSDNPSPRVKLPGSTPEDTVGPRARRSSAGIPEVDELTRRFAQLRR
ncbi:hypothetical protein ASPZODRAFT_58648, partial [Penicilliopsis zonata CBS 506.65]